MLYSAYTEYALGTLLVFETGEGGEYIMYLTFVKETDKLFIM